MAFIKCSVCELLLFVYFFVLARFCRCANQNLSSHLLGEEEGEGVSRHGGWRHLPWPPYGRIVNVDSRRNGWCIDASGWFHVWVGCWAWRSAWINCIGWMLKHHLVVLWLGHQRWWSAFWPAGWRWLTVCNDGCSGRSSNGMRIYLVWWLNLNGWSAHRWHCVMMLLQMHAAIWWASFHVIHAAVQVFDDRCRCLLIDHIQKIRHLSGTVTKASLKFFRICIVRTNAQNILAT